MDEEKRKEIQLLIENTENENETSVIKKVGFLFVWKIYEVILMGLFIGWSA